ncbi:glycine cleavage system T protein [Thecamonas trahens ATCC 50062]|uniref:Aminomethyltransferase n=1 Tax=Thecamonas trahens ATCC 50062 TaxID=461836 RepID=A0A0L0DFC2_THETB|nr:glycine cleavage system T protein [Thecamonas trahens ATCC 50062]KNC50841.1 glycine cleavage system T protein [Thecamonas trahens ATCC 50062]|eukprot:XP_013756796.1 glycine cleavage system T protein [Thecamonas trahens ATCC 50062]
MSYHAGLFDVSHMGVLKVCGPDRAEFMERLVPGNLKILKDGACRLSAFLNADGGIIDDAMFQRFDGGGDDGDDVLMVVVNASRLDADLSHIEEQLALAEDLSVAVEPVKGHSLLALQGPEAAAVFASLLDTADAEALPKFKFMTGRSLELANGMPVHATRCGYTGEDGFEILVSNDYAEDLARALLADNRVAPAGLGARDTLRLEAGLCLWGNDIDETTSIVEADLSWFVGKRRKDEANFIGAERTLRELADGPSRLRRGLIVDGAPVRQGAVVVNAETEVEVGVVTSGAPSPSLGKNIAQAYIATDAQLDKLAIRGRRALQPAHHVPMPFVTSNYHKV